jgi:hypothetical protein
MSGHESAPGNSASDYEPQAYSEQLFEPSSLLTEFRQRQETLASFVDVEVGAYYLHQAVCARIVQLGRYPRDVPFENGIRRVYSAINHDPEPGNSEKRRFIKVAKHIGAQGVEIPMLTAATPIELEQRLPVTKDRSFWRSELLLIHGALQKRAVTGTSQNSLLELFLGHPTTDEVVQQKRERQQEYIGWLRIAASELKMPNRTPKQLRPYYPETYNICPQ